MTINKFGKYELPLTPEEKATLVSHLSEHKKATIKNNFHDRLTRGTSRIISSSLSSAILFYYLGDVKGIQRTLDNRINLLLPSLKRAFPEVTNLFDENNNWNFIVKLDGEGFPKVHYPKWVSDIINKEEDITINLENTLDEYWIEHFNRYSSEFKEFSKV